jgi:beta-lactamase regulating signal transducer with metallopeptidase domain
MNRFLEYVGGDFIYALGWTLIHSIWQVGFLAVVVALIMSRIEVKKAAVRYAVFMSALLLAPILSVITFVRLYSGIEATSVASTSLGAENPYLTEALTNVSGSLVDVGTWEMVMNVLRPGPENLQYLVIVWFAGVLMLSVRFMGGVWAINRLRGSASKNISDDWKQRLAGLSDSLGIRRIVQMAESARVTVPMTAGWLKPIILLPIGMLSNMPPAHVEMILLHELSHIRRHDYLMNVIQGLVEIMFFFHPAIWWLSDGVRTEREHCCDDRVLSLKGDPLAYAKALHAAAAAVKPRGIAKGSLLPKTGLALTGENGELLERIHRILNREMKNTIYSTRFTASTVMVVGLCLFLMLAPSPSKKAADQEASVPQLDMTTSLSSDQRSWAVTDTVPPKSREVTIVKNTRGVVTELYVNGKLVPSSEYGKYEAEISRAGGKVPTPPTPPTPSSGNNVTLPPMPPMPSMAMPAVAPPMPDSARWAELNRHLTEVTNRITASMANFDDAEFEKKMAEYEKEMEKWATLMERDAERWAELYEKDMERWGEAYGKEMEAWAERYEKEMETNMNSKEWKQWEKEMEAWGESFGKNMEAMAIKLDTDYSKSMKEFGVSMESFGKSMEAFGAKMEAFGERMKELEAEIQRELVRDGILDNEEQRFSLKMTKDAMYVDGVKLSDRLTEKYRGIIRKYNSGDFNMKNLEFNLQFNQ